MALTFLLAKNMKREQQVVKFAHASSLLGSTYRNGRKPF